MKTASAPLFDTFDLLKSAPLSVFERLCKGRAVTIAGPFASELAQVLRPGCASVQASSSDHMLAGLQDLSGACIESQLWDQDVIILTDASLAAALLTDHELLRRACFASKRTLVLPVKDEDECIVSARPDSNFCLVAEDDANRWTWCVSEEAQGAIQLVSHLRTNVLATLSFKLVVSDRPETPVEVDQKALLPNGGLHRLVKELWPGVNELLFRTRPYQQVTRHGGLPFYFSVYNLEIAVAGGSQKGFELRPDPFLAARSMPASPALCRSWLHHAGFSLVERICENGTRATLSRGTVALPWPLMPDGLLPHEGDLSLANSWSWLVGLHRSADTAMFGHLDAS